MMKLKPMRALASSPSRCAACGVPWYKHHGIGITCAKLTLARNALKQLRTMARARSFRTAEVLIREALDASAPNTPKP